MGGSYSVKALGELPTFWDGGTSWTPIRHVLGIAGFGINAYGEAEAGAELIEDHDESDSLHEEVYFVVSGAAEFTIDGKAFDAPAGTLVHIPDPATTRSAVSTAPDTTVLCIGGVEGAFEPRPWEARGVAELSERLGALEVHGEDGQRGADGRS
jgi:glyoxylate utilization-related uncharacterized protein